MRSCSATLPSGAGPLNPNASAVQGNGAPYHATPTAHPCCRYKGTINRIDADNWSAYIKYEDGDYEKVEGTYIHLL